jgi:hypothetical protein
VKYYRWYGYCIRLICTFSVLYSGCSQATGPKSPQKQLNDLQSSSIEKESEHLHNINSNKSTYDSTFFNIAKNDLSNLPHTIFEDTKDTFLAKDNLIALLLAGGASIAMNQDADNEIADHFKKHHHLSNFEDETLNVIGHPGTHFAVTGIWYAISVENNDRINHRRALTMATALTIDWAATIGLKAIRNNETPNGKDWAWPSGHTSSSFTVASVLDEFYGPKVGIPAYAAASLVAYRMMDTGDHWTSDVVFGATLGWIVGHSVAGKHEKLEVAGFKVLPLMAATNSPAMGISLLKQF